ncbi:hypothetical protein NPIL_598371 [Nephila pilipes]|uniref:Uncharacterized protein n=1 Tax=Nephila pilipes TaxID=299642 RepID=A0A8X6THY3_NEPPI|nr:hypothetical protein NPIL_598371 [Nephila pilipes]
MPILQDVMKQKHGHPAWVLIAQKKSASRLYLIIQTIIERKRDKKKIESHQICLADPNLPLVRESEVGYEISSEKYSYDISNSLVCMLIEIRHVRYNVYGTVT